MSKHRTAQGKMLDMSALAAKHEKVRAVGNMKVNARGDTIDSLGKIIVPVTEKTSEKYSKTVGNRSANATRRTNQTSPKSSKPIVKEPIEQLTKDEMEFMDTDEEDNMIELLKTKGTKE